MNTGDLIRLYRDKKGLSLLDLANKVGISKQSIYLYERSLRTPSPANSIKLCGALGIDIDEFQRTLPNFEPIPSSEEIAINPRIAINAQISSYVDPADRKYVSFLCDIILSLNYDITFHKTTVIIENLNKKNSDDIYIELDDFITISYTSYFMNSGIIETLNNKARQK